MNGVTTEVTQDLNRSRLDPSNLSSSKKEQTTSVSHLGTDHLLTDLKRHTVSGGIITGAAQVAKFVLNLGSTVVLARLLTPRDFGLVAMVTAVTGFLTIFRHGGLAT